MGSHPANLVFRFFLETALLIALGYWGWTQGEGVLRYALAAALPLAAAFTWGTFGAPKDPTRSGDFPVRIPGLLRLLLELALFAVGVAALFGAGAPLFGWAFALAVVVHYVLSYDRLAWLVRQ